MTVEVLYEIDGVTFCHGSVKAVDNLSLEITGDSFWGIVGPNGCGKTTLLDLLAGIKVPEKGKIKLLGKEIEKYSRKELARKVALVPQEFYINFPFTVHEVLLMGRHPYIGRFGIPSPTDLEAVEETITLLGLSRLKSKRVTELSGGEKQRVVFARAIVQETPILLLDEPTSNMDVKYTLEVLDIVASRVEEKRITVISAFHDLNIASTFCDRVIFMKSGRIVSYGRTEDVFTEKNVTETFGIDCRVYFDSYSNSRKVSFRRSRIWTEAEKHSSYSL